jgi:peptide/nickel transport system substrate-binding protein
MFEHRPAGQEVHAQTQPELRPRTDPDSGRLALPDNLTSSWVSTQADIDNRLLAGDLDVDINGTGVQAQTQGKILGNPALKANRLRGNAPAPGSRC